MSDSTVTNKHHVVINKNLWLDMTLDNASLVGHTEDMFTCSSSVFELFALFVDISVFHILLSVLDTHTQKE